MKKKLLSSVLLLATIGGLAACGSSDQSSSTKDTTEDKGLEKLGDKVVYNPNQLVNTGEPIALEYWTWGDNDPIIDMAKSYEKIYPNVTIKVVNNPWDDYWTKLPLSLKGKDGPAIFGIHNSKHDLVINYLEPYDISVEDLKEDFSGVESHIIDDNIYYIDSVINTGNIYYNKDLWKEASLTDKDIPKTWDEFTKVSQKLTKKDGKNIVQAGFNWNDDYQSIYEGLNYQKGTLLFNEDGTVNFDNKTTEENLQFLNDLYDVAGVGSKDFGSESTQSFGNGQTAMVYKWGWFKSELDNKYPDIEYGVFATPTPTNDVPFAYDRYNGESTPGINKNQSKEQISVAQDFVNYCLANDEYSLEAAEAYGSFPTKYSLANNEKVINNPVLAAIKPRVDRLIWPGGFPATVETTAKEAMEDFVFNGVAIEKAISEGQTKMNKDLEGTNFKPLESDYEFYDEAD